MKTYRKQKVTIQICATDEELFYLQEFGQAHGKTNNSEAFSALILSHKQYRDTIRAINQKIEAPKETYQEVRGEQIQKTPPAPPLSPYDKPEWEFLRGKPENPNLKSKIKLKRQDGTVVK